MTYKDLLCPFAQNKIRAIHLLAQGRSSCFQGHLASPWFLRYLLSAPSAQFHSPSRKALWRQSPSKPRRLAGKFPKLSWASAWRSPPPDRASHALLRARVMRRAPHIPWAVPECRIRVLSNSCATWLPAFFASAATARTTPAGSPPPLPILTAARAN